MVTDRVPAPSTKKRDGEHSPSLSVIQGPIPWQGTPPKQFDGLTTFLVFCYSAVTPCGGKGAVISGTSQETSLESPLSPAPLYALATK